MYITTRPGARLFDSFVALIQPIEHKMTVRPCESFGLYFVAGSHMNSILIRHLITDCLGKFV